MAGAVPGGVRPAALWQKADFTGITSPMQLFEGYATDLVVGSMPIVIVYVLFLDHDIRA